MCSRLAPFDVKTMKGLPTIMTCTRGLICFSVLASLLSIIIVETESNDYASISGLCMTYTNAERQGFTSGGRSPQSPAGARVADADPCCDSGPEYIYIQTYINKY